MSHASTTATRNTQTRTYLRRLLAPALISLSLLAPLQIAHANVNLTFQQVLQEERAWAGLQSKTLKVNNIEWSYSIGGQANKPTILLIHGLSGSRDNWNRVARYLTPHYQVIIPDLPFHGDTKAPADFDPQIANFQEELRKLMGELGVHQNLHVAGHSLGGGIGLLYASIYFTETQSLMIMNSAGVYKNTNSAYLKDPNKRREMVVSKTGDLDRSLKIAMHTPPFIPSALKREQEQLMIAQAPQTSKVINKLIEQAGHYTPDSFALPVRSIEAPTLIIWGDKDQVIDVGVVPELVEHLKNEEPPVILKGIGHSPLLEAEQLVIQHYLPFLQKAQAKPNPFAGATN
ncbi:MAG: alpha/beta hydrolase [Pseudomonadota bacterium]|nr:alpha/beta hydrolase [Pseudomonadota bacterium]